MGIIVHYLFCQGGSFERAQTLFIFITSQFRHCLIGLIETFRVLIVFNSPELTGTVGILVLERMIWPFLKSFPFILPEHILASY